MSNGFLGTDSVKTSTANQEIVPKTPENWTSERYSFYKFSFINKSPCKVIINGGNPIFLDTEQGFESSKGDVKINSFVIVEANVQYLWIGAY